MSESGRYHVLDGDKITGTIATLSDRIFQRFPDSGLWQVSQSLLQVARQARAQADWIAKPIWSLRIAVALLILLILAAAIGTLVAVSKPIREVNLIDFVQAVEAGINDLVLVGLAVFFLITVERRLKRHRALKAIHDLRSIAHIIDMHQLTKDPDRMHWEFRGMVESKNTLTPLELTRYLDYCSELLSLVGKVCVLYVQRFDDATALSAVNEVESLTTGLSRKIWQKVMIIHQKDDLADWSR